MRLASALALIISLAVVVPADIPKAEPLRAKPTGKHATVELRIQDKITSQSVIDLEKQIEWADKDGAEQILIVIDSPGGEVDAGFELSRFMRRQRVAIACVAADRAQSMGFYLLESCTERYVLPTATLTIHEPFVAVFMGVIHWRDAKSIYEGLRQATDEIVRLCAGRMHMSAQELADRIQDGDWTMDAKTALRAKAADLEVPSLEYLRAELRSCGHVGC